MEVKNDPPIHKSGPLLQCLVVGCTKRGLFRRRQSHRGYCREHRDGATAPTPIGLQFAEFTGLTYVRESKKCLPINA